MEDFLFSIVTFIFIYLMYLIFVILRKTSLEKFKNNVYVVFLSKKYNINIKKIDFKILANIIALTNSSIVSITVFIISYVPSNTISYMIFKVLLAFVVLVPLQLLMYHIIGRMYQIRKKD